MKHRQAAPQLYQHAFRLSRPERATPRSPRLTAAPRFEASSLQALANPEIVSASHACSLAKGAPHRPQPSPLREHLIPISPTYLLCLFSVASPKKTAQDFNAPLPLINPEKMVHRKRIAFEKRSYPRNNHIPKQRSELRHPQYSGGYKANASSRPLLPPRADADKKTLAQRFDSRPA